MGSRLFGVTLARELTLAPINTFAPLEPEARAGRFHVIIKNMKRDERFASAYEPASFEAEIYAGWEASGVFRPQLHPANDQKLDENGNLRLFNDKGTTETFSIVMPPPNANGNLHIGHGLTVALEDAMTRYHRLKGVASWYVPGADHAGFETWVVYERFLESEGHTRFEFSRDELYKQVWDFVAAQRGNMELQLRALGASCSWSDLTFTLDENVVARVYKTFKQMWDDGLIYRGEKLVNYCPKHQTAFADIEVEHKIEKGKLWDIAYPLTEPTAAISEIVVSTTRPETLFGDAAVAVNPEDKRYADLVGKTVELPLTRRAIPIITDEHADMEFGTGAVKITPAHDFNDFEVGERHNLPRIVVIDAAGKMTAEAGPDYVGLTTAECRKKVLQDLKAKGLLRGEKKIEHAVAHCYKCGTTIEPMLKEQWFVDVKSLADAAIKHLKNNEIKFHPASKKQVLINYLEGLKDWNISRQIPWGIAIPMFRKVDDEALDAPDWIFDERTHLTEIEVGGVHYVRDEDTFDTWFSSAHWPIVCTDWMPDKPNPFYPLSVMETGADILFAWVARMIMMGVYVTGEVPFREVYLHGLVLDARGQKMSKSKGNVLNPMELVVKYGSDAFRMGILRGRSAGMNQAFAEESVVAGRNFCNKLWNIARLVQQMVDAADAADQAGEDDGARVDYAGAVLDEGDVYSTDHMGEDWICREINATSRALDKCFAGYRFAEAVEALSSLVWDKYADWFLESQKLYKNTGLLKITLENLLIMAHPFAPFVTEAIWQNLSWTDGIIISARWPEEMQFDAVSAAQFEDIQEVVTAIRSTNQQLGGKFSVLFGEDASVDDNQMLIQFLARVPSVVSCEGQPRGLRLALVNHEVYLDVDEKTVARRREQLENQILAVGHELDNLNLRMSNPNYVEKAPEHLVNETRRQIDEKTELIERLKGELEVI